jgi:hypothetical protein
VTGRQGGAGRPGGQGANLVWSALFVVAAVVGGLAAADITRESSLVAVLVSLLVAAIVVIALYRGLLDQARPEEESQDGLPRGVPPARRGGSGGAHRADHDSLTQPRQPAQPGAAQPGAVQPDAVKGGAVQPGAVRLVQSQPGGGWWEAHVPSASAQGHGPGSGSGSGDAPGPRPVALSRFLDQALIAQCPKCGAFAVDVDNRAAEWLFSCQECRQRWTWQPGRPWPAIHLRPEVRGRNDRPRA